jgi:hypothetical protein
MTPHEKVHGMRKRFHASLPFLPFGTVCMVQMGDAKRNKNAHDLGYQLHSTMKQEVGVCMGEDPAFPQSYLFYIQSTNLVVPRRVVKVLSDSVIPFDWKPKPSMFQVLQQFPVDLSAAVGENLKIQSSNNVLIPSAPYRDVIVSDTLRVPIPVVPDIISPNSVIKPTISPIAQHSIVPEISNSISSTLGPDTSTSTTSVPIFSSPLPTIQSTDSIRDVPVPEVLSAVQNMPAVPRVVAPFTTSVRQSSRSTKGIQAPILHYDKLGGTNSYVTEILNNYVMPRIVGNVQPSAKACPQLMSMLCNTSYKPVTKSIRIASYNIPSGYKRTSSNRFWE